MGKYLILILLIPGQTFAKAPECPGYKNKRSCLEAVKSANDDFLDFIYKNTGEDDLIQREKMIEASMDIKKYESLACQKTCLN